MFGRRVFPPNSRERVVSYALPQFPHNLALLPAVNFVPAFYSQDLGLPIAMVGLMLFATRLTDVVTDPLIGVLSDHTRGPLGRRRPWILLGLPIVCMGAWATFVPAEGAGLTWLFWSLFVMYLGFTLVDIPYNSWGAELSNDYDGRSKVMAWKTAFTSIGALVALFIPVVLEWMGRPGAGEALFWMAVFYVLAQPLSFGFMMLRVPAPPPERTNIERPGFFRSLALVAGNGPYMRVLAATCLGTAGLVIGATLNLIIMTHVYRAPGLFPIMVFLQNVVLLVSVPLVVLVVRRLEKHTVMMGCLIMIAGLLASTFFWGEAQKWLFVAAVIGVGIGLAGLLAIAPAMIADIVDLDLLKSGEERTALFFSISGFGTKLAVAIGVLVGTALPAFVGFEPSDPTHSDAALHGLQAVYAFAGTPFIVVGALCLWGYSLTRDRVGALRNEIEAAAV